MLRTQNLHTGTAAPGRFLDLQQWPRRALFEFFRPYEQPFFNVCTEVNVSAVHARSQPPDGSWFFLSTLHLSLGAANEVEEFRLRLRGERVWLHERVHAGSTILRDDGTFGFAYFDYVPDYATFEQHGRAVIDQVRNGAGLEPRDDRDDLIHYSVLPWIRFTSFSHARRRLPDDSVPKIVFGKHFERAGERWLPVSVDVHHALVDGLHVARFLDSFESKLLALA